MKINKYLLKHNSNIEVTEYSENMEKPFKIRNTYRGNTTLYDFESLEEAIKKAKEMQKRRKTSVTVYEYRCHRVMKSINGNYEREEDVYRKVYNTKNEYLEDCDCILY